MIFQCSFSGTLDLPLWNIGGAVYSSSDLPAGFQYAEEGLYIPAVWESLNNTRFICFFIIYDGEHLSRVNSSPAYLLIYCNGRNNSVEQLPTHSSTGAAANVINSTICTNCTSGKVEPIIKVSLNINSTYASNTNCTNCTSGETEPVSCQIGRSH